MERGCECHLCKPLLESRGPSRKLDIDRIVELAKNVEV